MYIKRHTDLNSILSGPLMECNKEEAIRAIEIAEKKMQNKDFCGARKIALKVQQLYPGLENISQLLTVCDVHLSAENKDGPGNEKNYYDILKIDCVADEISIKKQYKKLALLLHPDKNKFAGATDAFKLIGEAQRVLLNRVTGTLHDAKLEKWKENRAQQQASNNPDIRKNPYTSETFSPFASFNPKQQQQQQPQKPPQSTVLTICPYCCMVKYQYYRDMVGKTLLSCQRCKKTFFTGHETRDFNPNYGQKVGPQKSGNLEVRKYSKTEFKPRTKVNCKKTSERSDDVFGSFSKSGGSFGAIFDYGLEHFEHIQNTVLYAVILYCLIWLYMAWF